MKSGELFISGRKHLLHANKSIKGKRFQSTEIRIAMPQTESNKIRKTFLQSFSELSTKKELASLLNDAKQHHFDDKAKPVKLHALTYYANHRLSKKRYSSFTITKKNGGERTIHAPEPGLKYILIAINFVIKHLCAPHRSAMGFVPDKSIVDNARRHVNQRYVYNIDLKDFFHSFDIARVKALFMNTPFNLRDDREPLAFLLARLCTHSFEVESQIKMVLPQGSPASPAITNFLCRKLDRRLAGLANRFGLNYSRYADDITFSSLHNVYAQDDFQGELIRIIEKQGFKINPKKTRLQKPGYRKEVTGLVVNEKVNVKRRYVQEIRKYLYLWKRYGRAKAENIFKKEYKADKSHDLKYEPNFENVISGKLEFLKMVKGYDDKAYATLMNRWKSLKQYQPHNPKTTTNFLMEFKKDGSGLKELIHVPTDQATATDILNNAKDHEKVRTKFDRPPKKNSGKFEMIPWAIRDRVIKLIEKFEEIGLPHYTETGEHPYGDDGIEEFTKLAREFKKSYRFGAEADSYSSLKTIIKRTAKDNLKKKHKLSFHPDTNNSKNFKYSAHFYTWVPFVKEGFKGIFEKINEHSNTKKDCIKVLSKITYNRRNNTIVLSIIDEGSVAKKKPEDLMEDFKNSKMYTCYFRSICDWSIKCKFIDSNYEIKMLRHERQPKVKKLEPDQHIEGFTHELTFYK